MRTIIAGSRTLRDVQHVEDAVRLAGFDITQVVSGGAHGVDLAGEFWARRRGIAVRRFAAQWMKYGASAGPRRNCLMAQNADALIAIWDGRSRGTRHMVAMAERFGLQIYVHHVAGSRTNSTPEE